MKIRQAKVKDLQQLTELRLEFALFEQKYVPGYSIEANNKTYLNKLRQETRDAIVKKNSIFLLAEAENQLYGYINLFIYPDFKDKVFMGELFVKSDKRRSGIASDLLNSSIQWTKNHRKNILHLTVSKNNKNGFRFFKKYGFKRVQSNYINLEFNIK